MNDAAIAALAALAPGAPAEFSNAALQQYIPEYVTPGALRAWNSTSPCPAGYTCSAMGEHSLGAFSCGELARIADEEFGFGAVLAGAYCPEGEGGLLNCPIGAYCPDSTAKIECPAGMFCNYKTSAATFDGGARPCSRCPLGSESVHLSRKQIVAQAVVFVVLCLLLVAKVLTRKAGLDREKLANTLSLHLQSARGGDGHGHGKVQAVTREQERYARLRPKLEVIAGRLGKLEGRDAAGSVLGERRTVVHVEGAGKIVFHAHELFDALDKDKDGELSYEEINRVLGLSEGQLRAFVANMKGRMAAGSQSKQRDKVSRSTFVRCFLDALADASMLEPTAQEAAELFDEIAKGVGTTENGDISYESLYNSILSSFLGDKQIYGLISRFKQLPSTEGSTSNKSSRWVGGWIGDRQEGISKLDFVECFPRFVGEVCHLDFTGSTRVMGSNDDKLESTGLDVAFENLCLTVTVRNKQVNVVDGVTGRLRSNTMTAVMGGSGSGKSSLLNALCGRAYYGKVEGTVKINGNDGSKIEEHKSVIGFVPQEDIVYPDLTVRENLLYSGRLQLPAGTTEDQISDLADATMAALGLSRIAKSLVGDAKRRGVSGGEKKRVNIGLELMKKPKILFLDEPTSGLDSRSAFVVMESLKHLVSTGMTVACVIHQPRTDIYDMFDSLFLLGVGGQTVYHGPATECKGYFEKNGFQMKEGESQADWFLDISSGDISSGDVEAMGINNGEILTPPSFRLTNADMRFEVALQVADAHALGFVLEQETDKRGNFIVREISKIPYASASIENDVQVGDKVVGINGRGVGEMSLKNVTALLTRDSQSASGDTVFIQILRQVEVAQANHADEDVAEQSLLLDKPSLDKPSNEDETLAKARVAREKLYRAWNVHFENLPLPKKARYFDSPEAFPLPITPAAVPGWSQLLVQLRRNCLLSWRNRESRLLDCVILLIAVFLMTMLAGVTPSDFDSDPGDLLWIKFIASPEDASQMLPIVFYYSLKGISTVIGYAMMVGLLTSVLIGLNATKIITDKRLEFFREAQSGISVSMYYLAATITTTVEQGFIAILGSALAYLISNPSISYLVFLCNFFLLSWLSVSWAILLAIVVPQESVSTVVGFFNAFFGLLFCGKVAPGTYTSLYGNPALSVFAGFFSSLRFFVEGMAVSEAQCLPNQSGYTTSTDAFQYPKFYKSYPYWKDLTFMAHTDLNSATSSSCGGWFWWVGAAFAVGITVRLVGGVAIHFSGRGQQGKKSFRDELKADFDQCRAGTKPICQSFILNGILVFVIFAAFFALSCWLILREHPENDQFL